MKSRSGFTIVELLVVIVVIVILAAITIASYNGAQARARDTKRVSDVNSIEKSLYLYRVRYGSFPNEQSASWEDSINYSSTFINSLVTSGITTIVPIDPINSGSYYYRYYLYPAGSYGCDATRGDFYVLMIMKGDTGGTVAPSSPGFACSGRNWQPEAWWVDGDYTN